MGFSACLPALTAICLLVCAALCLTAEAGLGSDPAPGPGRLGIQEQTLDNGLQVLVLEEHSAPLVCSYIWYRVGLRNEPEGEAGITHFLEHMAFKGTPTMSGREMDRLVTRKGGYLNGFTSMDYTAYVETLPRDSLDLALRIESDRMANCLLAADDLETEKGVVLSEFESAENDPSFLLTRKVMAAQFPDQPYGRQVLGEKADLRALTRDKVLDYYRRHYAPNNAVLVVVGDVQASEVFAKAEQYFGDIPRGEPPTPLPNPGRGPTGEQRVQLEVPGRTSYLQVVYEVPPIDHPDHVVLEVIQNILSGGRTSRLYRALVDSGLASQAGCWDYENPQPTAFVFQAALRPGVEHEQVERALDAVIEELGSEPVGQRELAKAKNQTKAHFVYSGDGVSKLAQQIGYYHLIASYHYLEEFPGRVDAVTAEDVMRVARQYFRPENRTVGRLKATGGEGRTGSALSGPPGPRHYRPEAAHRLPADAQPMIVPPPPGIAADPPVHEIRLSNGMRVILRENHAAPFVSVYGNVMAGPVFEPEEKAGLAAFCAEMLSRGTEKRSWRDIQEKLDFVAARLGFGTGTQVATISGQCMTDDLPRLLEAAAEQLTLPSFPPEEIEKVRSEIISAQERRDEDTYQVAEKELFARLFPKGHPLHHPPLGNRETVSSITRDDLVAFHQRYYRPENTILAIVGDLRPEAVEELVERAFGSWQRGGEPARPDLPQVPVPKEPRVVRVPVANKAQVDIALGFPGIARSDPAYYQADLMNYLMGRGFMSRLNMRIREDMGLAYFVFSNYYAFYGPGPWVLHMAVAPEHVEEAIGAAVEEMVRIQREAPSEEELALWKDYVQGTVARQMETFSGIARSLVLSAFYDLGLYFPYQYPKILREITPDQVSEAAQKFLHPEGYIAAAAGPM